MNNFFIVMYRNIIRYWLIGILISFPVFSVSARFFIAKHGILSYVVRFIDEGTIVIFSLLAIWELYKNKETLNRSYLLVIGSVILFSVFGLISGIVNDNRFIVTILGTIDYIKYFLVIYIYAVFFRDFNVIHKVFRILLFFAVCLSILAIIEEIWALVFRYLLGKGIMDPVVYLFSSPPPSAEASLGAWRLGLFRAASFMQNTNIFGYYILFVLTIYMNMNRKFCSFVCLSLIGAILVNVSRTAYMGLFIVLMFTFLIRKINGKKIILLLSCLSMVLIFVLGTYVRDIDLIGKADDSISYREFARQKGMLIWEYHPVIGAGPGMFGGIISKVFVSPLYDVYKFPFGHIQDIGGIDQFWPQVLAETGIIGFILFIGIILALIRMLLSLRKNDVNDDINSLLTGLLIFLLAIYTFTFGTGFNTTAILFTYFAFVGIVMGSSGVIKRDDDCQTKMSLDN